MLRRTRFTSVILPTLVLSSLLTPPAAGQTVSRVWTICNPQSYRACTSIDLRSTFLSNGGSAIDLLVRNLNGTVGGTWGGPSSLFGFSFLWPNPFVYQGYAPIVPTGRGTLGLSGTLGDWGLTDRGGEFDIELQPTPGSPTTFFGLGGCGQGSGTIFGLVIAQGASTCDGNGWTGALEFTFASIYRYDPRDIVGLGFGGWIVDHSKGVFEVNQTSCETWNACDVLSDVTTISTVPEPATMTLVATGVMAVVGLRRGRRKRGRTPRNATSHPQGSAAPS